MIVRNIALVVQMARAKYGDTNSTDWVSKLTAGWALQRTDVFLCSDVE